MRSVRSTSEITNGKVWINPKIPLSLPLRFLMRHLTFHQRILSAFTAYSTLEWRLFSTWNLHPISEMRPRFTPFRTPRVLTISLFFASPLGLTLKSGNPSGARIVNKDPPTSNVRTANSVSWAIYRKESPRASQWRASVYCHVYEGTSRWVT